LKRFEGLVVATVTPYSSDGGVDWTSFDRMLDYILAEPDVRGVFVNGHAGDASLLSEEERQAIILRTKARLKPHHALYAGAVSMSTSGVCAEARRAEDLGADVIVPFAPPAMAQGGMSSDVVPMSFFNAVSDATSLPLSIFQMPLGSGLGMGTETLVRLVKTFPIVAIKEGSDTIVAYEDNFFALRAANPEVAILPSSYDFFLSQLAVGADGILSGLGSLAPRMLARLWNASTDRDIVEMRRLNEQLYPLIRAVYGNKARMHMHTRIKAGLMQLGVIDDCRPRGPLVQLDAAELEEIRAVVLGFGEPSL